MFREAAAAQDWAAIADWLRPRGIELDAAEAPRQFAGGLANLNYLVRANGKAAVFRRPPAGPLAHGASDMAREARVLTALNPLFPLAPRNLAFCDDPAVIGVPFQLLEYRPGLAIGGELPPGLTATDSGWLIEAITGTLARLHALEPEAAGLSNLGKTTGFAERQLKGWTKRAEAAFAAEAPPALAPLLARLGALLPPDPPARLLHMDAKFDNLLVDPESRTPTALIDWDMGTLGPPAFDLAVLLSYWIEPRDPAETHALNAIPSLSPGWPGRKAAVQAYARAAGDIPPHLGWHLGLARLRLATAWMQLYRLWQQGGLAGSRYAGFASLAGAILAQALDQFEDRP
ncbi:phosphotransferase family protein [Sandaracinobacter neustonicus]|uniref:Phosphotransferase family protein n=1 Tax=Sandaracinobacter neustonicus TaxID=1715348 RepID=A0A501XHS9_9SPHN|nr:phosphotransferase family protein [Sandaracinobacter neustonicus]TPE60162.1 phosphotransferase family protein [Sandaracinobacter neustonicus]